VHFQNKAHRLQRAVGIRGLGLHIGQINNGSVIRHKSSGQWKQGVFHPKTLGTGLVEHKQHTFVRRHVTAKHQANAALIRRLGNLGVDLVHAQLQLNPSKLGLGLVLGERQDAPQ